MRKDSPISTGTRRWPSLSLRLCQSFHNETQGSPFSAPAECSQPKKRRTLKVRQRSAAAAAPSLLENPSRVSCLEATKAAPWAGPPPRTPRETSLKRHRFGKAAIQRLSSLTTTRDCCGREAHEFFPLPTVSSAGPARPPKQTTSEGIFQRALRRLRRRQDSWALGKEGAQKLPSRQDAPLPEEAPSGVALPRGDSPFSAERHRLPPRGLP